MLFPQGLILYRQDLLIKRLGFFVAALVIIQVREVVEAEGQVRRPGL
jgi:hypothetical protein